MSTTPPTDLYDPAFAVAAVHELTTKAAPVLQEIINQGAAVLARCWVQVADDAPPHDRHVPVFVTYQHALEVLDGALTLLSTGRGIAASLPLRSAFEASLSIEYLCKTDRDRRAYAFLVSDVRRRCRIYERFVPGTAAHAAMEEARLHDATRLFSPGPVVANGQADIDTLKGLLLMPGWKEADDEWTSTQAARPRVPPAWYSLYNGPRTIRALAKDLRRLVEYSILYERWSGTAHAFEPERILTHKDGALAFNSFPDYRQVRTLFGLAMTFGIRSLRMVLLRYREEQDFLASWYKQEIQSTYVSVVGADSQLTIP